MDVSNYVKEKLSNYIRNLCKKCLGNNFIETYRTKKFEIGSDIILLNY